jgi:hypothetical protein
VSPYTRGLGRISGFYNQTSIVRSIEQIFGLKSKSYFSSMSSVMSACFTGKFDGTPFNHLPNQIPLDETSKKNYGVSFNLTQPDLIDDKAFNRAIWAESMPGKPYPKGYEGAHGKGLAAKGLTKEMAKRDHD